ncbi:MAG: hypothetical protein H6561_01145 [Lewinellaceae bacterium]|nr:hypothetical protein [Saprospiraceae bacterium]MCB9268168.1 hypothetical protein [Lewinellaceae bacterium]HPG09877.1 DUF6090 family protein [Saprospiraceae bacterium]
MSENKTVKYLKYAFGEIVLVAIGILIALGVNNWNENRKNVSTEHKYLIALLEDFETNLTKSKEIIERIEDDIPQLIGLLEQSALEKSTIPVDSLNNAFAKVSNMPTYSSTDRTYNNLVGSGELKIINDESLKTNLANYYKSLYILNLVQQTHESELVQSFQPFIIEYLDFQAVRPLIIKEFPLPGSLETTKILEVMKTRRFRNIVALKLTILADLLDLNRNLESINQTIVDQLGQRIL